MLKPIPARPTFCFATAPDRRMGDATSGRSATVMGYLSPAPIAD
jgi:hypothetical protein